MRGEFKATLTESEAEAFARKINGEGGFQSLLRKLQSQYDRKSRTVTITGDQAETIKRYAREYGKGGFEDQLKGIYRDLPLIFK